ncbi:uncharacterized protein [Ptychodera flava]|uniref:uncharacterized protein isoform X2 n=1 Tax=Ptychodera flava TaxID=63121 RepID=UPI00396AA7EA
MFAGNLQIAACILLSGNSFAKIKLMFQFANIANISQTTFYRMQNLYLAPTIDHFWKTLQAELLSAYQGEKALLSGDGRNDSPGHSSQYLSYNVGDPEKKVIVHTEVVDVREVNGKSPNMERLGFERSMDQLQKNIVIDEMVTDAHSQIAAVMKKCDKFKGVKHSWDLWHGGKNIHKKVVKASQNKKCRDLLPWASTIRNHFWYAAKESKGSERKMKAIWFGILHHVVNEHEWLLNIDGTYGKCAHSPLTEENQQRPWIQKGSPAHVALKGIVEDKRFLRTFSYYVNFRHSGFVESFHSHLLMYAPKRHAYTFEVKYSKQSKRFYPTAKLEPKKYEYIGELQRQIFQSRQNDYGHMSWHVSLDENDPRRIHSTRHLVTRPSLSQVTAQYQSRFATSQSHELTGSSNQ